MDGMVRALVWYAHEALQVRNGEDMWFAALPHIGDAVDVGGGQFVVREVEHFPMPSDPALAEHWPVQSPGINIYLEEPYCE